MELKPLDVGVVKGHYYNPMDWIIFERTSTFWGHCFVVKNAMGDIFDPRTKGVENNHISKYAKRQTVIRRYKHDFDIEKVMAWCIEHQKLSHHYDFLSVFGFLTGAKALNDPNSFYCSEFPYWAWQENGYKLTDEDMTFIYPCFFMQSNDFITIK
jgi:hypothetical protein